MHLFDSNGLDDIKFQESDNFSAGTEATIVDTSKIQLIYFCVKFHTY